VAYAEALPDVAMWKFTKMASKFQELAAGCDFSFFFSSFFPETNSSAALNDLI
jgi:hypothetical protein